MIYLCDHCRAAVPQPGLAILDVAGNHILCKRCFERELAFIDILLPQPGNVTDS